MRIPLSNISMNGSETRAVGEACAAGLISGTGPAVREFEQLIGRRAARAHVVATGSGTLALEVLLLALGVGPGDEVIVPAWTFVAPAAAVRRVGAIPVLCDVDIDTWTVDPQAARSAITPATKAIIAVSLLGHAAKIDELLETGVAVIEDAAQAHGGTYMGRPSGSLGLASVFSFHANKSISTGEGGCVAMDDEDLAEQVRLIVNHGMTSARPYWHDVVGTNARMSNLAAAFGVAQAQRWTELTRGRQQVAARYRSELSSTSITHRPVADWVVEGSWIHVVRVADRDAVVDHLRRKGIDARPTWPALSELPAYRVFARSSCSVAAELSRSTLMLPTWAGMGVDVQSEVISELQSAAAR